MSLKFNWLFKQTMHGLLVSGYTTIPEWRTAGTPQAGSKSVDRSHIPQGTTPALSSLHD